MSQLEEKAVQSKESERALSRFIFEFQLWRAGMGGAPVGKKSRFIVSSAGTDAEEAAKKAWDEVVGKFATHLWLEDGIIWDIGVFCRPLSQDDLAKEEKESLKQIEDSNTVLLRKNLTYRALEKYAKRVS